MPSDVDGLAASSGVALVLSVAANVAQWRALMSAWNRNYEMSKTVADLAAGLRESLTMWERILHERRRAK